jgi:hypothetical protein
MKRSFLLSLLVLAVLGAAGAWYLLSGNETESQVRAEAQAEEGRFDVLVTSSGELKAKSQTDITGPGPEMVQVGFFSEVKIEDLIQEGTVVKAGDYVASLEKNSILGKLSDAQLEVDKKTAEMTSARLDTTLNLREARDELFNLKFAVEQAVLELEQSRFEAPATIRQKEIELEKARKNFQVKQENYQTKVRQNITKVQIIQSDLSLAQGKASRLQNLISRLTVQAPKDGMVIYARTWNGTKKVVGSTISPWEPTVATLPDLSQMQVLTYINEVDIQKIKVGQYVEIGLDAEPGKKLEGGVRQVANIGEQKPNTDAKVFEVVIDVLTPDTSLRPAMTTSCKIFAGTYAKAVHLPLECLNTLGNHTFVYKKDGSRLIRQEVRVGAVNETRAIVYAGIRKGEPVLLSPPADTSGLEWAAAGPATKAPAPVEDEAWKKRWALQLKSGEKPKSEPSTPPSDE